MSATEYAIGRHCGVTFAGLKIASLVSLRKGEEDVIQTLSRRFAGKGFAFILLREDEERLLVYICHRARLEKYLFSPDVRAFLARFGYGYASAEEALEQLKRRMKGEFPHERGSAGTVEAPHEGRISARDRRVPRLSARRRVRLFARSRRLYSLRRVEGVRKCGRSGAHVRAVPPLFRLHLPAYGQGAVAHADF